MFAQTVPNEFSHGSHPHSEMLNVSLLGWVVNSHLASTLGRLNQSVQKRRSVDTVEQPLNSEPHRSERRSVITRSLAVSGFALFAAFWIWALFFASKEGVNRVEDREWVQQAQTICEQAADERTALANYTRLDEGGAELILQRADIVDEATDSLARMLNSLEALPLTGEKGRAIVPMWIDEYRVYLGDRRNYTEQLRATGENLPFYETANKIPISERLATFAADNEMPACKPPLDLDI